MNGLRILATGALLGGACTPMPTLAQPDATGTTDGDDHADARIVVTGVRAVTRDKLGQDAIKAPQSISIVGREMMDHQATNRLEEALKNVPGITLNAGEGAARGDTVNLRGFPAYNDIFLDGIRDAAVYTRDSFNLETLEVLKGPSAVLFGRGSTGGAINQVSKAPTLAPLWSATLVAGLELGREHDETVRLVNPFGTTSETPATPLLNPDPFEPSVTATGRTRAVTTAYSTAAYVIDTMHVGSKIDLIGGVRYDRFSAHYRPEALVAGLSATSLVPLDHVDQVWSPRASLVFKPTGHARFYASYGTSFDPSAEALSLSTKTANLAPVIARSYEVGAKFDWLGGKLTGTAALFRTRIDNAQVTDPDHPTQIVLAGNQRVDGLELGLSGHLTEKWELTAGYTHLNGKTLASSNTATVGKALANVAPDAVNIWTEYEFSDHFELGVGGNYLGKRYADFAQSATLPGYVMVDAMAAWTVNPHLTLRVNANNIFDKLAWVNSYYSNPAENHVIPSAGRTVLFTAAVKY